MPDEVITPYINIPIQPLEPKSDVRYGSQFFRDVQELQVGYGAKVMRVDQQGLWLGAETFAAAPFSVDMDGNVVATSLSLGTLSGTLDDIANGSTYKKTTFNEVLGASYGYSGLNSSGEIIKGFLNSQLSAKSLPTNGVRVDSSGIYGRQSGSTTFYIDSAGNAYFTGSIASASMSASTITGSTITGTTLSTATSGQRVVLYSTLASYYNSSGTLIASTYAASSSFLLKGETSTSNIYLDAGSSGSIAFLFNGTIRFIMSYSGSYFAPSGSGLDLGNISNQWYDFWHNGTEVYQGIDQPVTYFGTVYDGDSYVSEGNEGGWSVTNNSTGVYTVTHSLSTYDYAVTIVPINSSTREYVVSVKSSSYFRVRIYNNATASLTNSDFMFILTRLP